jgi:Mrp family chromosome partitioning ATPase
MTALDRALIKAYRAERSGPARAPVEPAPARLFDPATHPSSGGATMSFHSAEPMLAGPHRRPPQLQAVASMPAPAPGASIRTLHDDATDAILFRVDRGIADVPAPKGIPLSFLVSEPPASAVPLTSRPLSSYSSEGLSTDEARPQLVVDRFAWPEVCDDLRMRAGAAFAEFLKTSVLEAPKVCRAVALVGTDFGVGCTTTALCLAQHLAARGMRPAIVDANFARPELADQLSVKVNHGWDAALIGTMPLGEVLIESLEDHMVLAPLRAPTPAEPLVASSLRASLIWQMLREAHDVLLVDAGTVDDEASLAAIKSLCEAMPLDGLYAVYDIRSTTTQGLINFSRHLKVAGVKLLGMIENFVLEGTGDREQGTGPQLVHS